MLPRLSAFYGPADPKYGAWGHVPVPLLRAYSKMLPRLEAQRTLEAFRVGLAVQQMTMEEGPRQEWIEELEARATGSKGKPLITGTAGLAAMGIEVKRVNLRDGKPVRKLRQ